MYGGDTSSIAVTGTDGRLLVLDAGTAVRALSDIASGLEQIDILVSHLHIDHVQGLPFFQPLLDPDVQVDIWGPISTDMNIRERLSRYLSPPLFPVRIRDLPNVWFHDVPPGDFEVGPFKVLADLVSHPGPTLGYRLEEDGASICYIPDHEPALAGGAVSTDPEWMSGYRLARGCQVLIHDSQYTDEEYADRVGWGHTSHSHLLAFAAGAGVERLVTFHHDPGHDDSTLDAIHEDLRRRADGFEIVPGKAGLVIDL